MIQSQETYLACVTEPFAERSGVRRIRKRANNRFAWQALCGHAATGLSSIGAVDCLLECTYMRIPSDIRMGFFCFLQSELDLIEHAAKKKVGQAVLFHCFGLAE